MSGRGQHFIPQHFQKPFVISEDKDQIWMYRRGMTKPLLLSRADAAKQRDFYSSPGVDGLPTLDDLITDYEQQIFPKVDALRGIAIGATVASDVAAEIVVHFSIRSQHLRNSISELWNSLAKTVYSLATNPNQFFGSRRLPAHRPPKAIAEAIREQIIASGLNGITQIDTETLVRIFYMGVREQLDQITREARDAIALSFSELGKESTERTKDTHRSLLLSSLAPPKRVAQLNEFHWKISAHIGTAAIIPDCVCVAANTAGDWQPFMLADDVSVVIMPLTPNSLLVGQKHPEEVIDLAIFNSVAASSCFDFFLSKEEGLDLIVEGQIGQSVRAMLERMTSEKVLEALDTFLTAEVSAQAAELNQVSSKPQSNGPMSFTVAFYDFQDEAVLGKVAAQLKALVGHASIGGAASALDGFTFANDYERALNSLDRGFAPTGPLKPTDSPLGVGVAMPVTVKRDQVLKTHIVLRSFVAAYLSSEDENEVATATALVRHLLASLILDQLERSRFAGWMLQGIGTPLENYLYGHARSIFDTYFSARFSAVSQDDANEHIESIQDYLSVLISSCIEKRREYRLDGDLDPFLHYVFQQTAIILCRFADILGGYAGVAAQLEIPPLLNEEMSKIGMTDWLKLFAADLSHFYENLEQWQDFEEIFFTHRHFERWLIFFGVVIEERAGGDFYVHVPLGSDLEYLSQQIVHGNQEQPV